MTERVDQMLSALPRGNLLDDRVWGGRHRLLLWLLLAHIPGLLAVALAMSRLSVLLTLQLVPVAAGLAVGMWARGRLVRSLGVTVGLAVSSTVLLSVTSGLAEAHFHYFVVVGLVALYQDWRPYLVALAYIVVGHGIIGAVAPGAIYSHPQAVANPWLWALVHGAFVLAACGAQIIFWKQTERQQVAAHAYYAKLYEGERAVVDQLRQAQNVKDGLIGVVGHEFRTPLTSIQGFARTLDARWERMDRETTQTCTQAIQREAKRMTRMVSNLLTASEDLAVSPGDRCVLRDVAATAVNDVMQLTPMAGRSIRVDIPADHAVALSPDAATQLLANLLDNAVKFAAPDSKVRVTSRVEGDFAVVEVANVGPPISEADQERIFDAFVQADSSDTRRYGGMGLGLHIVRKIVDAYGGRVAVYSDAPLVIFRTWLPLATPAPAPAAARRRVLERLPVVGMDAPRAREHSHP